MTCKGQTISFAKKYCSHHPDMGGHRPSWAKEGIDNCTIPSPETPYTTCYCHSRFCNGVDHVKIDRLLLALGAQFFMYLLM